MLIPSMSVLSPAVVENSEIFARGMIYSLLKERLESLNKRIGNRLELAPNYTAGRGLYLLLSAHSFHCFTDHPDFITTLSATQ